MHDSILIQAPAKVNLALAVGPVDPADAQGRHRICTWMVGIDLYDDLTITPLESDRFSRYAVIWHREAARKTDIDWSITSDLAVRAHLLLEEETGRRMPIQLKNEKRIPVGAGLGGGSSDAAGMLIGCNRLFDLGLSTDELRELGRRLGSDVPFFVRAQSSIARGLGDEIEAVAPPSRMHFVLLFPEFGCDTAAVYASFDALVAESGLSYGDLDGRLSEAESAVFADGSAAGGGVMNPFNHLMVAAFRAQPELRRLRDEISELIDLPVHMTGSGSTLFAICDTDIHAEFIAEAVNGGVSGVRAIAAGIHESSVF